MKVGIDFDRVLFDTDAFNNFLHEQVDGLKHVEEPPYDEHGCYDPEKHARLCGLEKDAIYRALDKRLERFLYSDVSDLDKFPEGVEKIIVTRGEKKFQELKVENSGAKTHVDGLTVIEEGSKDVNGIDFLVDDREEEIERAGVPGFVFDRENHTIQDVVRKVEQID